MDKQVLNSGNQRNEKRLLNHEIPFEMTLVARLMMDEICYNWNRQHIQKKIDRAIDEGDFKALEKYSDIYRHYIVR